MSSLMACAWLRGSDGAIVFDGVRIAPAAHPRERKGGREAGAEGARILDVLATVSVWTAAVLVRSCTGRLLRGKCVRRQYSSRRGRSIEAVWVGLGAPGGWCCWIEGLARCGPVHLPVWDRVAGVVVGWMGSRLVVRGTGLVTVLVVVLRGSDRRSPTAHVNQAPHPQSASPTESSTAPGEA